MTLDQQVHEAAAWLDGRFPRWEQRVDPETLDIGSCTLCVWGQLLADDARLGPGTPTGYDVFTGLYFDGPLFKEARSKGFAEAFYRAGATPYWRAEIRARRDAPVVEIPDVADTRVQADGFVA